MQRTQPKNLCSATLKQGKGKNINGWGHFSLLGGSRKERERERERDKIKERWNKPE